jgi:hypothetical protein
MAKGMTAHTRTPRNSRWLLELPMELIIKVMMHLDFIGLESLAHVLNRPLTGLIQIVLEPEWWPYPECHSTAMKNVLLEDLKHSQHKSLINLVDIQELEEREYSEITEIARLLSGSINHISLSRFFGTTFEDYHQGLEDRILKLVNLLPNSQFILEDSTYVLLHKSDIDLGRMIFLDITYLSFVDCGVEKGEELDIWDIGTLHLENCTNELVECIPLDSDEIQTLYICYLEHPLILEHKTINIEKMVCTGGLFFARSTFAGSEMELRVLHRTFHIDDIYAPNLNSLILVLKDIYPSISNLHAPNIKSLSILVPGKQIFRIRLFAREHFISFQNISELTLTNFRAPLYLIDFHNLKRLNLTISFDIPPNQRVFPVLEILEINLTDTAYCVPFIKADNLKSLTIRSNTMFLLLSIIPTLCLYDRLTEFSFINNSWWLGAGIVVKTLAFVTRAWLNHRPKSE